MNLFGKTSWVNFGTHNKPVPADKTGLNYCFQRQLNTKQKESYCSSYTFKKILDITHKLILEKEFLYCWRKVRTHLDNSHRTSATIPVCQIYFLRECFSQ